MYEKFEMKLISFEENSAWAFSGPELSVEEEEEVEEDEEESWGG